MSSQKRRHRRPSAPVSPRAYLLLPLVLFAFLAVISSVGRPSELRVSAIAEIDRQTPVIVGQAIAGDPAGALDAARALVEREDPRRVLCHGLYHSLGLAAGLLPDDARTLLELAPPTADLTNEQCESGYLHGVLIAKSGSGELADEDFAPLCRWFAGEFGLRSLKVCLHGVGHALGANVATDDRRFAGAGELCAAIETATGHPEGDCEGGMAMEYFERVGAPPDGAAACLALASPGRERCVDVYATELVFISLEPFGPADRPSITELCGSLSGRFAWACRGAAGSSAANAGIARGREFLIGRLDASCEGDPRCLAVGVSEAALIQGPDTGRSFCRLLDDAFDCATVVGTGLRDAGECVVFGLVERPRCEAASRGGRVRLDQIVPPPTEPGTAGS